MTPEQIIRVLLELRGGPAYKAGMTQAAASTTALGKSVAATSIGMETARRRTWAMNQAMFTLRRYTFYGTLAVGGMAAGLVKLGVSYLSAMQQARVALRPMFTSTDDLNEKLQELFNISKYSPFVIKDVTIAFRQMYIAMNPIGISAQTIVDTIQSMTDALSVAGKVTPAALNRVAVALQHMAFQGRLTGYTVTQLARDGLPIYAILNKQLGLTGDQLHNIASMNIPVQDVLKAINDYIKNTPGYAEAALRQSLYTIHGQVEVFRDSVSQIMGTVLGGPKGNAGLWKRWQDFLFGVVHQGGSLDRLNAAATAGGGRKVVTTLSTMLTGHDWLGKGVLELTNLIVNLGKVFTTILLPSFVMALHTLAPLYPLLVAVNGALAFMTHHATLAKIAFTLLATAFVWSHTVDLLFVGSSRLLGIMLFGQAKNVTRLALGVMRLTKALKAWAFAEVVLRTGGSLATGGTVTKVLANNSALARLTRTIVGLSIALQTRLVGAIIKLRVTMATTAAIIATNPFTSWIIGVGVLITALALLIKYHEKIQSWERNAPVFKQTRAPDDQNQPFPFTPKRVGHWIYKNTPPILGGGQRAIGGPVNARTPYTVGERGPELFVPNTTGRIIPNNVMTRSPALEERMNSDRPLVVHSYLMVDRQVIAEANARAVADKEARR